MSMLIKNEWDAEEERIDRGVDGYARRRMRMDAMDTPQGGDEQKERGGEKEKKKKT